MSTVRIIEGSSGAVNEDPRRTKSRARVLAAAVELLREVGLSGLTIEAVAARSGVAKTTIYRQFADRDELHLSAVHSVGCQQPMAYTADLVADITSFCTGLNGVLRDSDFGALLSTAVDGAERSESFAGMMHDAGAQRRQLTFDCEPRQAGAQRHLRARHAGLRHQREGAVDDLRQAVATQPPCDTSRNGNQQRISRQFAQQLDDHAQW